MENTNLYNKKVQTEGTIYAVSNVAMAGLVRIGATRKNVEERIQELYNTSVPYPFLLECSVKVLDPYKVESVMHRTLNNYRVNPSRDFYAIESKVIKDLFTCLSTKNKPSNKTNLKSEFIVTKDSEINAVGKIVDFTNKQVVAEIIHPNTFLCNGNLYGFHQFMNYLKSKNIKPNNLEINNQKLNDLFEDIYAL